jgi:hypothetical protein
LGFAQSAQRTAEIAENRNGSGIGDAAERSPRTIQNQSMLRFSAASAPLCVLCVNPRAQALDE